MNKLIRLSILLFIIVSLCLSCNEDGNKTEEKIIIIPLTEIKTEGDVTLKVGDSKTITATLLPKNFITTKDKIKINISSSNVILIENDTYLNNVISFNLKAINSGTTNIYLSVEGYDIKDTIKITVEAIEPVKPSDPILPTSLYLDKNEITLSSIGTKYNFIPSITPINTTNKNIIWKSQDNNVATVNNGLVTATGTGSTFIFAYLEVNQELKDSCKVIVTLPVESIILTPEILYLNISETKSLTVILKPDGAVSNEITWESSKKNVATVNNDGSIMGLEAGVTTITAKIGDITASSTIYVTPNSPANLVTECIGTNYIKISWDYVTGATIYQVFNGENLIKNNLTLSNYTINNLTEATNYSIKVKACYLDLCSETPTIINVQTKSPNFAGMVTGGCIPNNLNTYDNVSVDIFTQYKSNSKLITYYLKPDAVGNGTSWSNAAGNLKNILEGITDATENNVYTILMAPGTYKAGSSITMKNYVVIIGGVNEDYTFSSTETTNLSGEDSYRVIDNITTNPSIDKTAIIYGLSIINGKATNKNGGGMNNTSSSPTVKNIIFSNNNSDLRGGGVNNTSGNPIFTNIVFINNSANAFGGAINNESNATPILTNITFEQNSVPKTGGNGGGAISNFSATPIIVNATFIKNSAYDGGAIYNRGNSKPIIINATFTENSATNGGAIFSDNDNDKDPTFVNCIIWGNTDNEIYIYDDVSGSEEYLSIYNSIIKGGTASGNLTLVSGNSASVAGNYGGITLPAEGRATINFANIYETDPNLSTEKIGIHKVIKFSEQTSVNKGLYVKINEYNLYYSTNNANWYSTPSLSGLEVTPPSTAVYLNNKDITGTTRVSNPDLGGYEKR